MSIRLLKTAKDYVPASIWERRENLYLIELKNNRAFVNPGDIETR